ncbi:MAG: hypothetical protein ACKOEM_01780 [Planctomycetia bacterium]
MVQGRSTALRSRVRGCWRLMLAAGVVAAAMGARLTAARIAVDATMLLPGCLQNSDSMDIAACATGSQLGSFLRLFDATGRELACNDDHDGSLDSYLVFTATAAIGNRYDVNRDGRVDFVDRAVASVNRTTSRSALQLIALAGATDTTRGQVAPADLFRLVAESATPRRKVR